LWTAGEKVEVEVTRLCHVVGATIALTGGLAVFTPPILIQAGSGTVAAASPKPIYHLVWKSRLSANADSTVVVAPGVALPNGTKTDVAVVLAGNNRSNCSPKKPVKQAITYAFDASSGRKLWQESTSGPSRCTTATPAVAGGFVYSPGLDGRIHKYALATGQEYTGDGWPQPFTLMPDVEKASANLVVSGNKLYATTSGFIGDAGHYEGHLVAINLTTGARTVWNSLCSNIHTLLGGGTGSPAYCASTQAGMFGRGQAAIDPLNGDVYVVTGNGPWNGRTDWGDSVLKISPGGGKLVDAFTPTNQEYLRVHDQDLGSSGPAILPPVVVEGKTFHLLVQGGKGGAKSHKGPAVLWLVDRDHMGSAPGPGSLGGQLQTIRSPGGCGVFSAPVVWTDPKGRVWVFYSTFCGLTGYRVATTGAGAPKLVAGWHLSTYHFTTPVLAGPDLYIARPNVVEVFRAATGHELWSSVRPRAGGTIGSIHWEYPAVYGNMMFMTDESGRLYGYRRT
jgi:PQQ-like domain